MRFCHSRFFVYRLPVGMLSRRQDCLRLSLSGVGRLYAEQALYARLELRHEPAGRRGSAADAYILFSGEPCGVELLYIRYHVRALVYGAALFIKHFAV